MKKCPKCDNVYKKIKKLSRPCPQLPYEEKLEFYFCNSCGDELLTEKMKTAIDKTKKWMEFEYFGNHKIRSFKSKDSYRKKDEESEGLIGEAPKGLYVNPVNGSKYLMKYPKMKPDGFNHGFREIATEFIMNKMAQKIIPTASANIGVINNQIAFVTKIFIRGPSESLIHGVEVFKQLSDEQEVDEIQKNRKLQKKFYTLEYIAEALQKYCGESYNAVERDFYRMILVDAWLGNQDRHVENWGLIRSSEKNDVEFRLAPMFDTARGLFWNHTLLKLHLNIENCARKMFIERYVKKSEPLISLKEKEDANHFDIAWAIRDKRPDVFNNFMKSLLEINIRLGIEKFSGMLHKDRLDFMIDVLELRRKMINCKGDG